MCLPKGSCNLYCMEMCKRCVSTSDLIKSMSNHSHKDRRSETVSSYDRYASGSERYIEGEQLRP